MLLCSRWGLQKTTDWSDDAVFNGRIANLAGGIIAGVRNGIRIGDIEVSGATAEHTGRIVNSGVINGNGTSGRGIDLEGDGLTIRNNVAGNILGGRTGIEVGDGSADVAQNNVITNAGNISGGTYSVDSADAGAAIRINSLGGSFGGNILGAAGIQDTLSIQAGTTTLTHDVLGDYDVRVTTAGTLAFQSSRTIEGNLFSRGTLQLDLSHTHTLTGDLALRGNAESVVEITDAGSVGAIGSQYTLIDVGGTFVQNGAAIDTSLLLDFDFVDSNDLVVEAVAAGTGTSASAKASSHLKAIGFNNSASNAFGQRILTAFADGGLNNTATFSNLAGIGEADVLGVALNSLAPNFNGTLVHTDERRVNASGR